MGRLSLVSFRHIGTIGYHRARACVLSIWAIFQTVGH